MERGLHADADEWNNWQKTLFAVTEEQLQYYKI